MLKELDTVVISDLHLGCPVSQKDKILAKLKAGEITVAQYKKAIGDIPKKIKALEKGKEISIEDEEDEEMMVNEDLVRLFQKRAGLLNG